MTIMTIFTAVVVFVSSYYETINTIFSGDITK